MKSHWLLLALPLAFAITCSADTKIKTKMSVGPGGSESTVLVKGQRMRTESNFGPTTMVSIEQCDTGRTIQLNDRTKAYLILTDSGDSTAQSSSEPGAAPAASGGGTIVVTMSAQDTGERKQFFGYTARHIKSQISTDVSKSTCGNKVNMKSTTDGWYIDLPGTQGCRSAEKMAVRQRAMQSGCQDKVVLKQNGNVRLGYPVVLETAFDTERGAFTMKQEATEVSNATLDASLFDIPAGYREVKTADELRGFGGYGSPAGAPGANQGDLQARIEAAKRAAAEAQGAQPAAGAESSSREAPPAKKAGMLRIGVLRVTGDTSAVQGNLQGQLASELKSLGADAVALASDPDDVDGIRKEAAEKQCDYVMSTAVTEFNQGGGSTAKKIGGILGGGFGGLGGKKPAATYEVKDTVRVYDPANSEAQSVTGENDYKDSSPEATFGGLFKAQARQVLMQIRKLRAQ